jgi:hypothetical protein
VAFLRDSSQETHLWAQDEGPNQCDGYQEELCDSKGLIGVNLDKMTLALEVSTLIRVVRKLLKKYMYILLLDSIDSCYVGMSLSYLNPNTKCNSTVGRSL